MSLNLNAFRPQPARSPLTGAGEPVARPPGLWRPAWARFLARCDLGLAPRLVFRLVIALAAAPFAGWLLPSLWLAVMIALQAIACLAHRSSRAGAEAVVDWLDGAGLSIAALYLVLYYTGAAQTLGVTLFGVVIFEVLVRRYAEPRRLAIDLIPPMASIVLVQIAACVLRVVQHRPLEIITVLASPFAVFWVFRALLSNLTENRRQLGEASVRAQAAAVKIHEAHRIAMMAEQLAGVGHWRYDMRARRYIWSDGVYRIVGLDPNQDLPSAQDLAQLWAPEDRDRVAACLSRAMKDGAPFEVEARVIRPDGEVRHVVSNGAAERDASGAITTVFGAVMDVTRAHLREAALGRSEERFRLLADKSNDVIMQATVSPDGSRRLTYISPAVEKVLGYKPDEDPEALTLGYVHPDDVEALICSNLAQIGEGPGAAPRLNTYRAQHKDGHWVWLEGKPTFTFDPETGAVCGLITVMRDVTAQKIAADELARAHEAAQAAAVAKSDFLANMSHEIRTPLTAILGFSDLLQGVGTLDAKARLYAQRIANGGRTLLAVVNDILDFSKLDAGQVALDPQPFDPAAALHDVIDLVAAQAEAKGLRLELDLAPDLPPLVLADSSRLRQVLLNLLGNALKFTTAGAVTLSAAYEPANERLEVSVADTGEGILAERCDRLFERFFQVDGSINRRHGGTGLGLAICKNLVELMGGEIGVRSTEGQGSTFRFSIAAPVAELAEATAVTGDAGDGVETGHVLVVDDLAENRELVRLILTALGCQVEEAAGGAEAVAAAGAEGFDLILMDVQMPGMDGQTAARLIRQGGGRNAVTPILALSANVLAEQVAQCLAAGMNDHIAKPLQVAELVGKVSYWIGVAKARSVTGEVEAA